MPPEFALQRNVVVEQLKKEAKRNNQMFYDGPHTRLIDYRATPIDASEQKHLELSLGPIGWYDFSVVDNLLGQIFQKLKPDYIQEYVDLDEVAKWGIIRNNKFTNILDTATTLVTSDGWVSYSVRSQRVSTSGGLLTSCVAENIHQEKDDSLRPQIAGELPAPFRTVLRGVKEELSPKLVPELVSKTCLYFLGLSFDLRSFHPDMLFMIALSITHDRLLEICRQYPGRDFLEGQVVCVRLSMLDEENSPLAKTNWVPGGKASLVRTREFLGAVQDRKKLDMLETIRMLHDGDLLSSD